MKKPHWTQTPEGKKKLAASIKKSVATRKANQSRTPTTEPPNALALPQDTFAYALGYVECWLDTYAKSAGVSAEALAARLGAVLHRKNGR